MNDVFPIVLEFALVSGVYLRGVRPYDESSFLVTKRSQSGDSVGTQLQNISRNASAPAHISKLYPSPSWNVSV